MSASRSRRNKFSWSGPLPFPLRVPGEGLSCGASVMRASEGCGRSTSSVLEGCQLRGLLSRAIPQILFADDVWPAYLKNPSEAGVNESLNSFHSDDGGSPGFSSIEQYGLYDGVKDPVC